MGESIRSNFFKGLWVLLIVSIANLMPLVAFGQSDDNFEPIYAGGGYKFSWSSDSRYLIFSSDSITPIKADLPSSKPWKEYDTVTNILSESVIWPLQVTLTAKEERVFQTKSPHDLGLSVIYSSPNGRYLVYAGEEKSLYEGVIWSLILGDRQKHTLKVLNQNVYDPVRVDNFHVIWNKASTAFVVVQPEPTKEISRIVSAYVNGFEDDISAAHLDDSVKYPQVGSQKYISTNVYDISSNGQKILIGACKFDNTLNDHIGDCVPLLYDVVNPSNNREVAGLYGNIAIAFVDDNETKFLAIGKNGLIQYDLIVGTLLILNDRLNTSLVREASFSPNDKWFAYTDVLGYVWVIPMSSQTLQEFTLTPAN
jgi:hypothetical protein